MSDTPISTAASFPIARDAYAVPLEVAQGLERQLGLLHGRVGTDPKQMSEGTVARLRRERDELAVALRTIVRFADANPFESVGHVVEHATQARVLLARIEEGKS